MAATPMQQQLHEVYMGLGAAKWREHIDLPDQVHGMLVYDACLHNGNGGCKEPGYMASMQASANDTPPLFG